MSAFRRIGAESLIALIFVGWLTSAHANVRSLVAVDLETGAVLASKNAGALNAPASLTKVMTLFVTLTAIENGELSLDETITVTERAAKQPAVRFGLRTNQLITVREALLAMHLTSANDAAATLADAIGTKDKPFVSRMNGTAKSLGLAQTRFANATGLPNPASVTTARDLALLTRALYLHFPRYRSLFGATSARVRGREIMSHNGLLKSYEGAIGLKTGFTCKAGYNTIMAATRDTRSVIVVVVGADSSATRNRAARRALDNAFVTLPTEKSEQLDSWRPSVEPKNKNIIADSCLNGHIYAARVGGQSWSVQLKPFAKRNDAVKFARKYVRQVRGASTLVLPYKTQTVAYRAGLTGMTRATAIKLCQNIRAKQGFCVVRSPEATQALRRLSRLTKQR